MVYLMVVRDVGGKGNIAAGPGIIGGGVFERWCESGEVAWRVGLDRVRSHEVTRPGWAFWMVIRPLLHGY